MKQSILLPLLFMTTSLGLLSLHAKPATHIKGPQHTLHDFKKSHPHVRLISYAELPHWDTLNFKGSLHAFQHSCHWLMHQAPNKMIGSRAILIRAGAFYPICRQASRLPENASNRTVKHFFEQHFVPAVWKHHQAHTALFTGYFSPHLKGSLHPNAHYSVPIYTTMSQHRSDVIAWVKSKRDRFKLAMEGSGTIQVTSHTQIPLEYKGIAKKRRHTTHSRRHCRQKSAFVLFKKSSHHYAPGVHQLPLTPGYSMAVDQSWIPINVPVLVHTTDHAFHRLMVAQDVGGAIKGKARGDLFLGSGKLAERKARVIKTSGSLWLLLPKAVFL